MQPHPQLYNFLEPYDKEIRHLAHELREFVLEQVPAANELLYDSYNSVVMVYSLSEKLGDAFCHLAVYSNHINFGFNRGAEITGKNSILKGTGKLIRHVKVSNIESFPKDPIVEMLSQAVCISKNKNPQLQQKPENRKSIVMTTSAKKRR